MNKYVKRLKNFYHEKIEPGKKEGWNRDLYRNEDKGIIAGVCAGIADYFDIDVLVVRIVTVASIFFFGGLTVFLYISAWILLATRPVAKETKPADETVVETVEAEVVVEKDQHSEAHEDHQDHKGAAPSHS